MPPPKKADPPHRLEFTTNSIRNTTIAVDTDAFYYEIVTRFWHPNLTKINKLDNETRELKTVAEIERVPRKETKVRFGGEEGDWLKASEFMKYDPRRAGGTYVGAQGVQYRWKTHNRRLQLVKADDEEKVPLVSYHPHHRHFFLFRMSKHAWLEIKPEATEALDKLIVSYLLVERRRRDARLRVKFEHSV